MYFVLGPAVPLVNLVVVVFRCGSRTSCSCCESCGGGLQMWLSRIIVTYCEASAFS